jgi:hypothetical protein
MRTATEKIFSGLHPQGLKKLPQWIETTPRMKQFLFVALFLSAGKIFPLSVQVSFFLN